MYSNYWIIFAALLGLVVFSAIATALILEWVLRSHDD
jgi:hypothetical protein